MQTKYSFPGMTLFILIHQQGFWAPPVFSEALIAKEVLILAKSFGFSKSQCLQLKSDIPDYMMLVQERGHWAMGRHRPVELVEPATKVSAAAAPSSEDTISPPAYRSRREAFLGLGPFEDQASK
jgi:hypothetical protein